MSTMSRRSKVVLSLGVLIAAAIWYFRAPREPVAFLNQSLDVRYVGDKACMECHQELSQRYARTAMGRSWGAPQNVQRIEQYDAVTPIVDEQLGFQYTVLKRGDKYFQEESRVDESGSKTHSLMREIHHVIGSGSHGRSYVTEHNGYLTIMPLSWFTDAGKWDLSPGYRERNQRFDREVALECAACHNGYPDYVEGSVNCYREVPQGIGCERCHGPGEAHVALHRAAGRAARASRAEAVVDRTIVNPRHLSAAARDDICAQCHLQSDVAFAANGRRLVDYRPGLRLGEYRRDFFLEPEDRESFGFSSHVPRMRLSACWSQSSGDRKLTCVTCHDPHVPLEEVPADHYVRKCLECHGSGDCSRPPAPRGEPVADNCIPCHMPKATPKDMAHTLFTEHWIRANPVLRDDRSLSDRASSKPLHLLDFWADDTPAPPADHAIALAHYLDRSRSANRTERQRAAAALEQAARQQPRNADLQFWLGVTLEALQHPAGARRAYEHATQIKPHDPLMLHSLGTVYRTLHRLDDAIAVLTQATEAVPEYLPGYLALASALEAKGDATAALGVVERALERNSYLAAARSHRASLLFDLAESSESANSALDAALDLDPDRLSLLWLRTRRGEYDAAIAALLAASLRHPNSPQLLLSLAVMQAQSGRIQQANETLQQIRARFPQHPAIPALEQEIARQAR